MASRVRRGAAVVTTDQFRVDRAWFRTAVDPGGENEVMRALICDDDATVRLIAKRVLEEHFGCTVIECNDGMEALARLGEAPPCHFAILDVDMPGMGGYETLEEIRASEATCDLPVVILTAERDEATVLRLMRLGVSDYIIKPLRHSNFVAKVDALLRTLPREQVQSGSGSLHIGRGRPALIADGDGAFRALLADQVQLFGEVVQVESGAAALMAFRDAPAEVVFIGADLGVMSAERVARKLREAKPWGVRLIRIVERADQPPGEGFDGVLVRSSAPDALQLALRPLVALEHAS